MKSDNVNGTKPTETVVTEQSAQPPNIVEPNAVDDKVEPKQPKDGIFSTHIRHRSHALLTERKELSARPSSNYLMNAYKKRRLMNTQNPTKRILRSSRGSKRDLHDVQSNVNGKQEIIRSNLRFSFRLFYSDSSKI